MDEENTETNSSRGSKKSTRGPTLCAKLKEDISNQKVKCSIEFDEYGDPIGDMAHKFRSYIGSVARLRVDINIESWDAVDETLKNLIWDDIKARWKLEDDLRRKQVLESASKSWRDFKANLVRYYMRNGKNPCETYTHISEQNWEIFKKTRESEEFKEKSEKAKANQSMNKHPHYLGKRGYKRSRAEWHDDDPLTSLDTLGSTDPSILSDERSGRGLDWVRARTKKKEGGGHFIPNEHTKEVFQKMGEWQGKILDGSWTPRGHDDVLSRALGTKEHGGRVRGVGGSAKIKNVFGSESSKQSGVVSMDQLEKATERVRQECQEMMNLTIRGIFDNLKQMGLQLPNNSFGFEDITTPKAKLLRSSCHSVDGPDHLSDVKIPTLCRLCVVHCDKGRVIVARGQFFPSSIQGGDLIHGKPIAPGNVKVCVDDVVADEFQLTPLPVPSDEQETVGDAIGSFVQWPKDLVMLGQDPEKKNGHKMTIQKVPQKVNKIASNESAAPIQRKEAFLDEFLSDKCRSLRFMINNLPHSGTTQVVKNEEVFKFHQSNKAPIIITYEDVDEFLRMCWLNIPILQIFMMYINKLCKDSNDDSFAFMCPFVLTLAAGPKNPESTSRYICDVMKDAKEKKRFILAPYIQDKHWMLLLFCLDESAVYVFDSLKEKRVLHVKPPWMLAYKLYVAHGGKKNNQANLVWYHLEVQCPQQEGGTECGYYVMRYMYDIVMISRKDSNIKWKERLGTRSYTDQEINEIRDEWADFFTVECL